MLTWIPAPSEGSLPAMVNTVNKDMMLVKTGMSATITLQFRAGKYCDSDNIEWSPEPGHRERFSRLLIHVTSDRKVADVC